MRSLPQQQIAIQMIALGGDDALVLDSAAATLLLVFGKFFSGHLRESKNPFQCSDLELFVVRNDGPDTSLRSVLAKHNVAPTLANFLKAEVLAQNTDTVASGDLPKSGQLR